MTEKTKLINKIDAQVYVRASNGVCNTVKFPLSGLMDELLSISVHYELEHNLFEPVNSTVFKVGDVIKSVLYNEI